ncbi:MAG: hypothetical protein R2862_08565 [Thermoanaerobaculia bacterium]
MPSSSPPAFAAPPGRRISLAWSHRGFRFASRCGGRTGIELALDGYPELLVVCGSIFLVEGASLRRRFGVPDAP